MTTKDILAQAQYLALREQLTPGDPALVEDFRQLVFAVTEHMADKGELLLRSLLDTNEELLRIIDRQNATITRQTARIEQLATALKALKRQHEGEVQP